jgi:hypothetical protein
LQVTDVNGRLNLKQGEYRLYTDVKLAKPDIISSIGDSFDLSLKDKNLVVYPNPARDRLFIETGGLESGEVTIKIIDIQGRQILMKTETFSPGLASINLDISRLDKGIYFLELKSDQATRVARWIKF